MSEVFVDASAMLAILLKEDDARAISRTIHAATLKVTSPFALLEVAAKLSDRLVPDGAAAEVRIAALLATYDIELVPVDEDIGALARDAWYRYGKGRRPARLNLGDCVAYACARRHRLALLYKGDDFRHTDIEPALKTGA